MIRFVGAGPGDPELLTRKGERLLRGCRVCVWAGSLVNPALLELLPEDCEIRDSSAMTLDETTEALVQAHRRDLDAVRLHTGDPCLYGAVAEQMDRLDAQGIPWEMVPGVSSFQAAAAALGAELTLPEESQAVVLARASGRTPVPKGQEPSDFAPHRATLCLFLSAASARETLAGLVPSYGSDCPAAAVVRASWPDQEVLRGTLSDLAGRLEAAGASRQAMIVVGRALERGGAASRLYDADFSHGWRTAP